MADLMYTPLESVFNSTMQREGRTVRAYATGKEFKAFMRRNDDGNNFENRITMYYSVDAPVQQGSIISFGNKWYILVNREAEENDCYYKSSGLACNGMINLNDGTLAGMPCYAYNMNGALAEQNRFMEVIGGNMEFITEPTQQSMKLEINKTFHEFGRTFKIENVYHKDGTLHLMAKVAVDEQSNATKKDLIKEEAKELGDPTNIPGCTFKLDGAYKMYPGCKRTCTAHLYDSFGREVKGNWSFETICECPGSIKTRQKGNEFTIITEDNDDLVGKEITLTINETTKHIKEVRTISIDYLY